MAEIIKPTIKVYWQGPLVDQAMLQQLGQGMEEEGIPYYIEEYSGKVSATMLSGLAAKDSPLDVGIGLDAQGNIAIHHRKLPDSEPLFYSCWPHSSLQLRVLGSHAARLVKGLPFKMND